MNVARTVRLMFTAGAVEATTHANLPAVRADGAHRGETATVERLTCDDPARPTAHRDHVSFPLADVVDLPGEADDEVDVEGVCRNGPYLWVVGSRSAKRREVKPSHSDAKAATRLASVSAEPSRRVLARIALADPVPAERTPEGASSAALGRGGLVELLAEGEHLRPFLDLTGKENGFDVEGIAVHGEAGQERVHLGLRGPVLRGWAVLLQLKPRAGTDGELVLASRGGHRCAKTFLDLDGLGIRACVCTERTCRCSPGRRWTSTARVRAYRLAGRRSPGHCRRGPPRRPAQRARPVPRGRRRPRRRTGGAALR
ncbi:DUF3616 domain-containing protein [Saccharopolyspora rhizosphaerae]|uniref:DUF3616 domain-containing protein n=1 Tax=Saccharopolyspora rhizosphaerae TaxID=2492662 RepID=UPI001F3A3915|nr:DUF3616 domain-containing protein [Saccharopolyspora rhizosphaerae]